MPHRISRTNSLAGSVAASDDASMFINKDHAALSEADSDDNRKRMSNELRKAFDKYLQSTHPTNLEGGALDINGKPLSNEFASNHNVEFETLSNATSNHSKNKPIKVDPINANLNSNNNNQNVVNQNMSSNNLNSNHLLTSVLGKRSVRDNNDNIQTLLENHPNDLTGGL